MSSVFKDIRQLKMLLQILIKTKSEDDKARVVKIEQEVFAMYSDVVHELREWVKKQPRKVEALRSYAQYSEYKDFLLSLADVFEEEMRRSAYEGV